MDSSADRNTFKYYATASSIRTFNPFYPPKTMMWYSVTISAVNAVWEQISVVFLSDLVDSKQARCEAVIRTDGMHTEY